MENIRLYLISDRGLTTPEGPARANGLEAAVKEALEGGLKAFQLREKDLATRELLQLARVMRELTAAYGARLFINDRVDVALAAGADGVHLTTASMPPAAVRRIAGRRLAMGVSTHSMEEALRAESSGADFITFGPVYDTPSKRAFGEPVGTQLLSEVAARLTIPVLAIGGIRLERVAEVRRAGAHGVALISDILLSANIRERTGEYLRALK